MQPMVNAIKEVRMFVPLQLRLDDLLTCQRDGVSVKAQSFQHQSTKFCAPNPAAEFGRCPKRKKGGLTASFFFVFSLPVGLADLLA